ncbi:hypothetical protein [Streptomyces hokutonensis]|uniref:hypothetical protein n=1 Tax=Streptomyces hokutonensis TaxID=1306990 RepID=UPI0037FE6D84
MSASPAALAKADFLEGHRLGVDAQPTLLLHTVHGTDRLGGPVASAGTLAHAPDQRVAATAAWSLPSALVNENAPMPALIQTVRAAGDTGLDDASALITGEREALLVDSRFTLAEQHRVLGDVLDSGKELTTVVVTTADPDHSPKGAVIKCCPDLGLLVSLGLGTRVGTGVMAWG